LVRFLDEATQGNALYQKLFTEGKMMPLNEYISYKAKSDNMPTNKAIIDYYDTVNTLTNIAQVAPHTFDTYFKNAQFNS